MARKIKVLTDTEGVDRREVGYYSTPTFVAKYLTEELLELNPYGNYVLDPATGKEELLPFFFSAGKEIDSYDIINYNSHQYSHFHCEDFIEHYIDRSAYLPFKQEIYDYIIANPPYNCHEVAYIRDNKKRLSEAFPIGTYNMYSMFLSAIINIAKDGCLIGVIISDSFLTATLHAKLREEIFTKCSIHQLILCPNDLFWNQNADVRTCIMILQKGVQYQKQVKILNRPTDVNEFKHILNQKDFKLVSLDSIRLGIDRTVNQFIIDINSDVVDLFKKQPSLGSMFKCVTCISTGNDKKYLSKTSMPGFSVPFYKNPAKRKFLSEPDAYLIDDYLEVSTKVKDFMVRNKTFLTNEGIVCSSMGLPFSAAYKPQNSVSGVNPTIFPNPKDIYWLMAYLNSSLVTYFVRGVLIRSNMVTSGYVCRIPMLNLTINEKKRLEDICLKTLQKKINVSDAIYDVDNIIFNASNLSNISINKIQFFVNNLGKTV